MFMTTGWLLATSSMVWKSEPVCDISFLLTNGIVSYDVGVLRATFEHKITLALYLIIYVIDFHWSF